MILHRAKKAQSATEYLMTYGWAILIVTIVLGAFYELGAFNGSNLLGSACIAVPGYYCQTPMLATTGLLSFTFGQNTGSQIFNIELACVTQVNNLGMPSNAAAWSFILSTGVATNGITNANLNNAIDLYSTASTPVSGLQCYTQSGIPLNGVSIGTTYTGLILMNYTSSACISLPCAAPISPWYTVKVASISTKVV
ncbi:MAG: hypothetical protein ACHQX1_03475 [Candidatus Micrarchaeales archaeon]